MMITHHIILIGTTKITTYIYSVIDSSLVRSGQSRVNYMMDYDIVFTNLHSDSILGLETFIVLQACCTHTDMGFKYSMIQCQPLPGIQWGLQLNQPHLQIYKYLYLMEAEERLIKQ